MSKTNVVSCRVDEDMLAILDKLAASYDRSRAWVVHKLLTEAAGADLKLLDDIDEGIAAIEAGDFCTHDELVERLEIALEEGRRAA